MLSINRCFTSCVLLYSLINHHSAIHPIVPKVENFQIQMSMLLDQEPETNWLIVLADSSFFSVGLPFEWLLQSFHHKLIAVLTSKQSRGGPSMLISSKSCRVLVSRLVLSFVLTFFRREKICST